MDIQQSCVEAYRNHKNLKLAAVDVGIPWQAVYVHLRNAGEPVTGDKLRYGSDSDRLAARSEQEFLRLVPSAKDNNRAKFQSKIDFHVRGYGVDVKASRLRLSSKNCKVKRWAFCTKKQEMTADFVVCFGLGSDDESLSKVLLIPGEIVRKFMTISLSELGGKWDDYVVEASDLAEFFDSLPLKH